MRTPAMHEHARHQQAPQSGACCAHHHDHAHHVSRLSAAIEVPQGTLYTCPMHPEVRQVGPGTCPICGMALEPEQVSLDDGPDPELIDMTRRFWIGLALTLPVFVLEMEIGRAHV